MTENGNNKQSSSLMIGVDDKISLWENCLYGFQHVFILILTPLITPIIFASVFKWDLTTTAYLVMIMCVGAGLETAIQCKFLKLPVAQAQAIIYIAVMIPAIYVVGPVLTWVGVMIASAITIFMTVPFKKGLWGKLLPYVAKPVIVGPLFIVMAISLAKVTSIDLIFPDYGQGVMIDSSNVILALIALIIPIVISLLLPKGILRYACILWGVVVAIIVAGFMGKIDFAQVAAAPWFVSPKLFTKVFAGNMGYPTKIGWNFIPVVLMLFVAEITNVIATVGTYQGTVNIVGQKLTNERTNRGLFVETLCSFATEFFGNIPCASYATNLGVLSLSRVGAKSMMLAGGLILAAIGVIYKVAVFFSVIPWAIYGGAMFMILSIIFMVGVGLLLNMEKTETNKLISGLAIIVGIIGFLMPASVTNTLPLFFKFWVQNPIGLTVVTGIVLNLIFVVWLKNPSDKRDDF